jgi:hypothetical protein
LDDSDKSWSFLFCLVRISIKVDDSLAGLKIPSIEDKALFAI